MEHGLPSMKSIKSLKSLVKRRNNGQEVVCFRVFYRTSIMFQVIMLFRQL